MDKIGIFYGPKGGSTERVAMKVAKELGEQQVELVSVKSATASDLNRFANIVFGISTIGKETWHSDKSAADWDIFLPILDQVDFSKKKVALFGLGDSVSYAQNFVDALGTLGQKLMELNATIIGQVTPEGYSFDESLGLIEGKFIGLPIDEDFEDDKTGQRVKNWVAEIKLQFI